MTFCIITHVNHGFENNQYFAYSPYVREMNIWLKYVDKVVLVAPLNLKKRTVIEECYFHNNIEFKKVESFNFLTLFSILKTLIKLPSIIVTIVKAMKSSDHIHLRCPGNMGLLGCVLQIFFPKKQKTAKYAGNWDLDAKQPLSYNIQKWILNNTFLTKNMNVLVYGEWNNSSRNVKPFFTASYNEIDKIAIPMKNFNSIINFIFVGNLTSGKRPLYAIQLVEKLKKRKMNISLSIYGNGIEHDNLKQYIVKNQLSKFIHLEGNKNQEEIKSAYQNSHFVILPSKSEGWPKVIAEGMFWKCLPIATKVSCVPNMLKNGERGILLEMNLVNDVMKIEEIVLDENKYCEMSIKAENWSRKFTLDYFENEIKLLLNS